MATVRGSSSSVRLVRQVVRQWASQVVADGYRGWDVRALQRDTDPLYRLAGIGIERSITWLNRDRCLDRTSTTDRA